MRAIIKEDHHVNVSSKIKDCSICVPNWIVIFYKPNEQMLANVVVNKMNALRNTFLKFKKGNTRRMRYAN